MYNVIYIHYNNTHIYTCMLMIYIYMIYIGYRMYIHTWCNIHHIYITYIYIISYIYVCVYIYMIYIYIYHIYIIYIYKTINVGNESMLPWPLESWITTLFEIYVIFTWIWARKSILRVRINLLIWENPGLPFPH